MRHWGVAEGFSERVLRHDECLGDSDGYHRVKRLINRVITLAWERREYSQEVPTEAR